MIARGRLGLAALAALGLGAACDGGEPVASGLGLRWSSTPGIPGPNGSGIVGQFKFYPRPVRIVSDEIAGDPETDVGDLTIEWTSITNLGEWAWPDAPPGRYTRIEIGGGDYLVGGSTVLDGETVPYVALDQQPATVTVPIDVTVAPGRKAWIHIQIDVGSVADVLPFETMRPDPMGILWLEAGDPGVGPMREALAAAFHLAP